ncbi:MAG TPA: valine--tRNA ligase [Thermodesulfobacteriota bacterium]|nr:valine--tRNA ligase [Thermodesulfobacteriota bacterium]
MPILLDKAFDPARCEARWYRRWLEIGAFTADPASPKPPFCIVIPPPNITGSLHMGHAFNNTLQDIVVRYKRMDGYETLWVPGTDHAGIATQNVVERQLAAEGTTRQALGREAFVERVWKWKAESGGQIIAQLKRLGASCDWTRERFTMDEGLSRAVREVFVRLYEEGLVYRADYIINWCPKDGTALSDLEVEHEEVDGRLYHVRYPLPGGRPGEGLVVATTRPETMLGDTAVAVHPEDERYAGWVGREVELPLAGRRIPVIADRYVDRAFGTGALKVTPAHDPNDFEIGRRHGLPLVVAIGFDARMTEAAGRFAGLDRFEARRRVVEALEAEGLLVKVEPYRHAVGHCYRCGTAVEPMVSKQWFVRIKPLAEPAIAAVREGRIRIIPEQWVNTYYAWMENIRDWTISRQIWWGHRIPAWYCDDCGEVLVARDTPGRCRCGSGRLTPETDVLDTWFSSALWPFSTLGWPDRTPELAKFYPTSLLVTGFDILFFWVARMIMMGLKFMGDVPFRDVYIHALVRDAQGQKMSKSKGNVIDPLVMIDRYGADAFRFTLAALAAPGRDVKLAEERIAGYRNFVNKLWNVSRFVLMHLDEADGAVRPPARVAELDPAALDLADRWILSRLARTAQAVRGHLDTYRFDEVARTLYDFVWHELADWYVELAKVDLAGRPGEPARARRQAVLVEVLRDALALLHPLVPFVTEEIWHALPRRSGDAEDLVTAPFPRPAPERIDREAEEEMAFVQAVVVAARRIRGTYNLPPARRIAPVVRFGETAADGLGTLASREALLAQLARRYIDPLANAEVTVVGRREAAGWQAPRWAAVEVVGGVEVFVEVGEAAIREEAARLERELARVDGLLAAARGKLSNAEFLRKAPEEVVEKERARLAALEADRRALEANLARVRATLARS